MKHVNCTCTIAETTILKEGWPASTGRSRSASTSGRTFNSLPPLPHYIVLLVVEPFNLDKETITDGVYARMQCDGLLPAAAGSNTSSNTDPNHVSQATSAGLAGSYGLSLGVTGPSAVPHSHHVNQTNIL